MGRRKTKADFNERPCTEQCNNQVVVYNGLEFQGALEGCGRVRTEEGGYGGRGAGTEVVTTDSANQQSQDWRANMSSRHPRKEEVLRSRT